MHTSITRIGTDGLDIFHAFQFLLDSNTEAELRTVLGHLDESCTNSYMLCLVGMDMYITYSHIVLAWLQLI